MSIKNAWLALIGKLPLTVEKVVEKEVKTKVTTETVKEVIGKSAQVMMYGFNRKTGKQVPDEYRRKTYREWSALPYMKDSNKEEWKDAVTEEWEMVYAHTCEQAHSEANGAYVQAVPCIRIGRSYFKVAEVASIKALDKPKA